MSVRAEESRPDDEPEADGIEEIVITAARPHSQGVNVQLLDRERLKNDGDASVVQALERLPAIQAGTGRRGERMFNLRGFEQRQTAVLLDGIPFMVPYDGQADTGLIPTDLVERIEVVKGPGSIVFGPNGLGGAVNIVTLPAGRGPTLSAAIEGAAPSATRLWASHASRLGPVGVTLAGGVSRSDGFPLSGSFQPAVLENGGLRQNSDRQLLHLLGKSRLQLGQDHELQLSGQLADGSFGVPVSIADPVARYWRFSSWRAAGVSLGHRGRLPGGGELDDVIYLRLYDNQLDSYDSADFTTQDLPRSFTSIFADSTWGARVRARWLFEDLPWGSLVGRVWLGGQRDTHRDESETGGEESGRVTRDLISFAPEVEALIGDHLSTLASLQVDLEMPDTGRDQHALSPMLALSWEPEAHTTVRLAGAHRTRFPTLKERFASAGGFLVPNPDLRPEAAWHLSLEAAYMPGRDWGARASVFDAEVADLIVSMPVETGLGAAEQIQNLGQARIWGIESALEISPFSRLRIELGHVFLQARRTDSSVDGDRLPYRPEHQVIGSVYWHPREWLSLSSSLRLIGVQAFVHPVTGEWGELGSYLVWDARVSARLTDWLRVWIRGSNLGDVDYQARFGYPDPGRVVWAGLQIQTQSTD